MDLHSVVSCEQQSGLGLAQTPPSFASLATTVPTLRGEHGIVDDEVLLALLQSTDPALDERRRDVLMEDAMGLKGIVRWLSHEHLRETELDVRLREDHGDGLILHPTDLFRSRDAGLAGVDVATSLKLFLLLAFFETRHEQRDAQRLRVLAIHAPRNLFLRHSRQEHTVPLEECGVGESNGITGTGNTHGLKHTTVSKLLGETLAGQHHWLCRVVRLQTTDVMRIRLFDAGDEAAELFLELLADGLGFGRSLLRFVARGSVLCFSFLNGVHVLDQVGRGAFKQVLRGKRDFVLVLFHKVGFCPVLDETGEVTDAKDRLGLLDLAGMEAGVLGDVLILLGEPLLEHPLGPIPIATSWQPAFVVKHGQDSDLALLDGVQAILVVREGDEGPLDLLRLVLGLLELEDEFVELLLQGLVGEVDAQLLERVDGETLETENIQNSDGRSHVAIIGPADTLVDLFHDPQKQGSVNGL
mmetsp:Transcript_1364/g.3357  ORF Transcript_1364/g.3357 Transcript_1364/m.3357 type:complete len:470 (-) Transcript_1364:1589-2998(-)